MARFRAKNFVSPHAKKRIKQRYEGNKGEYELSKNALHFGVIPRQLPAGSPLRGFMEDKKCVADKRVKLLNGYIFIFSKSKRLITMYQVPEEYQEEAKAYLAIQSANRERYREAKEKRKVQ